MKYPYTKRSGFLFILLSIVTLGIASIVILNRVSAEVNRLGEDKAMKRTMSYTPIYFLGFITLGIVPLVYFCRLARKISLIAASRSINKPKIGYAFMFYWLTLGCLILIGPFIAFSRLFRLLNRVERSVNEELASKIEEGSRSTLLPEPVEEAVEETIEEPLEEGTSETPLLPVPEEEAPVEKKRFCVRMQKSRKGAKYFDTKEEALAYAKTLAAKKKARIRFAAKKEASKK